MTATPDKLSLNREESSEVTVTVTGEYDYPVEGEDAKVKFKAGCLKKSVTVKVQ
ncbi:MAG: hypothetical protein L6Q53_04855 [Candidatus Brocadia sinica]|uniref:Uncharacterized protein n=1 Tax=Candidatus Brocadia sinica JPN1 TaxID=1197129 RepID=A0ABQ0JUS8_9BACT|nr:MULTISPECIES: hypothetical protein [Brocadia]MCK6467514.1 hypothetical protein [Candidatus Brocadia sinica]NOG41633.1 hypothetical protein [Planctomycetota bacterium]GAN32482.1 hypothetical protein BROSI_A0997 [Candidatus Brocadia sinica JPN1]GIK13978.1 MAG: hypothetical protein BroJett002_26850 [Candidatus Brocadia sinica]GJQ18580.1 MAG: hypothetical protein HBSIN01_25390 [Candidatus Brocadia sinica]